MQIVWNKEVAQQLKNSHTVLELETFDVEGERLTAYCLVPPEKVINDIAQLGSLITLHESFIQAMNNKDYKLCTDISEHLRGRFGGELDSFYDEILKKISQ